MKIFVSIASYCDDLLFFTLKDAYQKANNPENLVFGVVDQHENNQIELINKLSFSEQIRYVFIDKLQTQGVCWARNLAFSLYDDEKYLLQIDSHMLFEEDWDKTLIQQYNHLHQKSKKPIISTYPYDFSFDEQNQPKFKKPAGTTVLVLRPHPETILQEDNAVLRFRAKHKFTDEAVLGCHIAAGFIFTSGNFIYEVPYDPFLYFHGEEQSLALRSFTKGWDIYHPTWIPLYHCYKKTKSEHASHHWHKSVDSKRSLSSSYLKQRAIQRINQLCYQDSLKNSIYGLGTERNLKEYFELFGIDYENKKIIEVDSTLK